MNQAQEDYLSNTPGNLISLEEWAALADVPAEKLDQIWTTKSMTYLIKSLKTDHHMARLYFLKQDRQDRMVFTRVAVQVSWRGYLRKISVGF